MSGIYLPPLIRIFGQFYLTHPFILTEYESHSFHGHFPKMYDVHFYLFVVSLLSQSGKVHGNKIPSVLLNIVQLAASQVSQHNSHQQWSEWIKLEEIILVAMCCFLFVFYLFLCFYFVFYLCCFCATWRRMWDLSSPTKDRTRFLRWKCRVLTTGLSRKSDNY